MSGMNLRVGAGLNGMFGGNQASAAPSATQAAYGPTANATNQESILNPTNGHGLGFWLRVGVIVVAVCMYQAAPR
jgi:hypothetical protein